MKIPSVEKLMEEEKELLINDPWSPSTAETETENLGKNKTMFGILIVFGVVITWVGSSEVGFSRSLVISVCR